MSNCPRITLPPVIKQNDVIEVRTIVAHVMETGQRKDKDGALIPRNIINNFKALFLGRLVFVAEIQPSLSANPLIAFHLRASDSGELMLIWTDDNGQTITDKVDIVVA